MRLLEPFSFSVFTLKNRAVSSWAIDDGRLPAQNGWQAAGMVMPTRLTIDGKLHADAPHGAMARILRRRTDQIHAWGGYAVAHLSYTFTGRLPRGHAVPADSTLSMPERELGARLIERFVEAATLGRDVGFDGVELHIAPDSPAVSFGRGPAALLLDVTEAVGAVLGIGRVGVGLSAHDPHDATPYAIPRQTLLHVAAALDQLGLAWLHLVEPYPRRASVLADLRRHFGGAIIAEGNHTLETAEALIGQGLADCVVLHGDMLAARMSAHPASTLGKSAPGGFSSPCSV